MPATAASMEQWARTVAARRGYTISDRLAKRVARRARTPGKATALVNQALGRSPQHAPNFDPRDLDGCVLFADPNDDSTKTTSGGDVTVFRDKAQGLSFTVPSGDNAPADGTATTGDGRTIGALTFDGANSEALEVDTAAIDGTGCLILVFEPDDEATTGTILSLADKDAADEIVAVQHAGGVAGDPFRLSVTSTAGGTDNADGTEDYTTEPYVVVAKLTSATSRAIDVDGTGEGTDTASNSPAGLNRTSLGRLGDSTPGTYGSGKLLLALAYDRVPSDDELALLRDYAHRQKIHDPGVGIPAVGLVLDLDATDASSLTITSSPDVDAWANRANKGIASVTQGTASQKPHTGGSINGLNALTFDAAALNYLEATDSAFRATGSTTLVVARPNSVHDGVVLAVWQDGSSLNRHDLRFRDADFKVLWVAVDNSGGGAIAASLSTWSSGEVALLTGVEASASSRFAGLNGELGDEGTDAENLDYPSLDRTAVGRLLTGTYLDADVGRALVYKRVLPSTERRRGDRALSGTWGVE